MPYYYHYYYFVLISNNSAGSSDLLNSLKIMVEPLKAASPVLSLTSLCGCSVDWTVPFAPMSAHHTEV